MSSGEKRSEHDLDRELIELLNELRVALPGVQVLFAFLLIVPFTNGWANVTEVQRYTYFVAFLCAALASAFLIAPSTYHRLRWREGDKDHMLVTANRLAIWGAVFLAAGMTAVAFLITDLLFGNAWAAAVAAALGGTIAWLWFGLALVRDARIRDRARP
jgi:predicted membrane channel-forming protein YqfA (hemolysin III family)